MLGDLAIYTVIFTAGWYARARFGTFAEMRTWVRDTTKRWTA